MGIKVKGNEGDLTGVSRKSRKATASKMGDVASARANQIKTQSENGFKGQTLNDHGLPAGPADIIQKDKYASENGPKYRKEVYADGVKGIKLSKPKVSSDATSTRAMTDPLAVSNATASKISKMSDKQLYQEMSNDALEDGIGSTTKLAKKDQIIDSLASRNIKRRGGYKDGTKSIKVKSK